MTQPGASENVSDDLALASFQGRKVLHLIDTGGPGGAETVLASIVHGLDTNSWHSRVVVPEEDWLLERLRSGSAEAVLIPSQGPADWRYLRGLIREIRRFRPAVVHTHLLASAVYGTVASVLSTGVPLVCTFHGKTDIDDTDRLPYLKARILSRRANRIVYVSHDLRQYLERLLGIPPSLGVTIHNGISFADPGALQGIPHAHGANWGPWTVGAVGNIRHPKDYPNLLLAAAEVHRHRSDVRFLIAGGGGGDLATDLHRLRKHLGLDEVVEFLGFRDDVPALMQSFDLYVSSSWSEGLPLAALEAMGMGKPVVLTRCGGPEEIVDSGRTGVLVPPRDPRALARGILDLLTDPGRMASMGAAGKTDVVKRFSLARMLADYEHIYRELINLHGAGQ